MRYLHLAILGILPAAMLACAGQAVLPARVIRPYVMVEKTFYSYGPQDGYVVETGELDSSSTSLRVGDENGYPPTPQIVSILSFDTSSLPDDAIFNSVVLVLKQESSIIGEGNPFVKFHGLLIDVRRGSFGQTPLLEAGDFAAPANLSAMGPYMPELAKTYTFALDGAAYPYINRWSLFNGLTQFRLHFVLNSDGNARPDYIHFHSGDETDEALRPQLVIRYHLPTPVVIAAVP